MTCRPSVTVPKNGERDRDNPPNSEVLASGFVGRAAASVSERLLAEERVDTLRLRAHLAPLPLRGERDAMIRDMQTTIRYEHSLDSAMRPVRPDGISRRTREHPCDAPPDLGYLLLESCASRRPGRHDHCGVSVKSSSESESAARRSLDPGEEIDPTEEHTLKPYPIRDSGVLPSPCHERDLPRGAGEGAQREPPAPPRVAERSCWRADRLSRAPRGAA